MSQAVSYNNALLILELRIPFHFSLCWLYNLTPQGKQYKSSVKMSEGKLEEMTVVRDQFKVLKYMELIVDKQCNFIFIDVFTLFV